MDDTPLTALARLLSAVAFALAIAAATLIAGCAGGPLILHWQGGDVFGVTEDEGRAPSRIDCPGTLEQRFACFTKQLRRRAGPTSGAFAVVAPDGALLDATTTEPRQRVPTNADTLFPLASITKMFTAAAAVRLSQDGVLDLHRPISSYLSELGAGAELGQVSVHQLLTHTGGLLDAPDQPLCVGDGDLTGVLARTHVAAPPGAAYLYSNTGYSLVGVVIERATGKRFEDVVGERVLQPMEMASATFDGAALLARGQAAEAEAPKRCRAMYPAGGLIASSRDLARWAQAMNTPDTHPLGRELVDALTASHVSTGERPGETYGYGVTTTSHGGVRVHNHGGNLEDSSAFVAWVPARKFTALALANTAGGSTSVAVLRGLSVFLDLPDDWRPSADGESHPLTAFVGTYFDRRSSLKRVRIGLEGDHLVYDYPDGPPGLPPAKFRFRFTLGEERARFVVTAVGIGERVTDE